MSSMRVRREVFLTMIKLLSVSFVREPTKTAPRGHPPGCSFKFKTHFDQSRDNDGVAN